MLRADRGLRGIVVDLRHVEEGADEHIRRARLEDRCQFVVGDFFGSVPPADGSLLKHILRDWPDDDVIRLPATAPGPSSPMVGCSSRTGPSRPATSPASPRSLTSP